MTKRRAVALLPCFAITRNQANGMVTLDGLIDLIQPTGFPTNVPEMPIYMLFVGEGSSPFTLRLLDPKRNTIAETSEIPKGWSVTKTWEWQLNMRDVPFAAPGAYVIQVSDGADVLVEREILLRLRGD